MSVWGIIGIVFGCILLIIAVLLLLPVKILITSDEKDGIKILAKYLWYTFGEKVNPNSKLLKNIKQLTGISKFDSVESIKRTAGKSGAKDAAVRIIKILFQLVERAIWILKRCKIKSLRITSISADTSAADAALDYGQICAVVYPFLGYLLANVKHRESGLDIDIRCDFEAEESVFEVDAVLVTKAAFVAAALLYVIKKNVEEEVRREVNYGHSK